MNDQGSQGSNSPDEPGPYKPVDRADAEPKPLEARRQKYEDGKKLRLKNEHGIFQYTVYVVSARYDKAGHSWMYTLKDHQKEPIPGEKKETALR